MTQYKTLNVQFSSSQLNELNLQQKWYWSNFYQKISSNVFGDSNDETYFPH